MTIGIRNLEWHDHNSERAYPLTRRATRLDTSGTFTLPSSFIVAAYLAVHSGLSVDPNKFYIRSVGNYTAGFGVDIGYDDGSSSGVRVATMSVSRANYTPFTTYRLTGVQDFGDVVGSLMLGPLDDIDEQPAGAFQFDPDGGELEPDVIRPMLAGISGIRVSNGGELSRRLVGDIVLRARANMRISVLDDGDSDPQIIFDAVSGENLADECICEETTGPPIRRINDIPPTLRGDFRLLGSDCLEITPIQNGLQLNDTCSEPCCGCKELSVLTAQLETFGRQATTLENFLTELSARVTQMDQSLLASRLGDRGCNTCE